MGKLIIVSKVCGIHTVLYDDKDENIIKAYTWYLCRGKSFNGLIVCAKVPGVHRTIFLHRVILSPPDGYFVDHINMNRLDNRRCNLRIATKAQNSYNRPARRDNTSGYKGVWFRSNVKNKCWIAEIRINGKKIHIGTYQTKEEAALAYNEAAKKYHGEFARLNDVRPK